MVLPTAQVCRVFFDVAAEALLAGRRPCPAGRRADQPVRCRCASRHTHISRVSWRYLLNKFRRPTRMGTTVASVWTVLLFAPIILPSLSCPAAALGKLQDLDRRVLIPQPLDQARQATQQGVPNMIWNRAKPNKNPEHRQARIVRSAPLRVPEDGVTSDVPMRLN